MNTKKYLKTLSTFALGAACLMAGGSSWAMGPKPMPWRKALQQVNQKQARRAALSVLGDRVGESVGRMIRQTAEREKINTEFNALAGAQQQVCRSRYTTLAGAMQAVPLFNGYMLTAVDPVFFCRLSQEETGYLSRFLQGSVWAASARRYQKVFLLTLQREGRVFWFVVDPQQQLLAFSLEDSDTINFNPLGLDRDRLYMAESALYDELFRALDTPWINLSVR